MKYTRIYNITFTSTLAHTPFLFIYLWLKYKNPFDRQTLYWYKLILFQLNLLLPHLTWKRILNCSTHINASIFFPVRSSHVITYLDHCSSALMSQSRIEFSPLYPPCNPFRVVVLVLWWCWKSGWFSPLDLHRCMTKSKC